jgi:LysM repeat protein
VPEGRGKRFEKVVELWKDTFKPSVFVHKVSRGETLDSIARKYNSTRQQICCWNNIAGNKIRIGQTLKIYR